MANSLATAVSEPALYRLLTFHVPNKMSLFLCPLSDPSSRNTPPRRSEGGVVYLRIVLSPEKASRLVNVTWHGFSRRGVSTSPNPQAGGPPLVGSPRLLIQYIRSYPPYRRPFLQPQPEDASCRGDRDPLNGILTHSALSSQRSSSSHQSWIITSPSTPDIRC